MIKSSAAAGDFFLCCGLLQSSQPERAAIKQVLAYPHDDMGDILEIEMLVQAEFCNVYDYGRNGNTESCNDEFVCFSVPRVFN